jgi:hypothetical protein
MVILGVGGSIVLSAPPFCERREKEDLTLTSSRL